MKYIIATKKFKMANVLILNGSPHSKGCTATALNEVKTILEQEGIEVKLLNVGNKVIRGCTACGYCGNHGQCAFKEKTGLPIVEHDSFTSFPDGK